MHILAANISRTVTGKHCFYQYIESRLWPFDWYIYISIWPVLKVKITYIRTVNISKMVTDKASITNSIKYEVEYGLSIKAFKFDLGLF